MTKEELKQKAEEYANNNNTTISCDCNYYESKDDLKDAYLAGAEFGYNKANEWHNLKTEKPPLRKEVLWCIDNQLWLGQLCESWIDFGEWDIDSVLFNDHEIAWKEIVLPELPKEMNK